MCVYVRAFIHTCIVSSNSNLKTGIEKAARATNCSSRSIVFNHNNTEDAQSCSVVDCEREVLKRVLMGSLFSC